MGEDISKALVTDRTKVKLLAQLESEFLGEEDFKDTWKKVEALAKQGTVEGIVEACINASWDLEAFTEWVLQMVKDLNDAKRLLGEAVFRQREWDT